MSQRKKIRRRVVDEDATLRPTFDDLILIKQTIPPDLRALVKLRITSKGVENVLKLDTDDNLEILMHPNDWAKLLQLHPSKVPPLSVCGIPVVKGDS